MTDQEIKKIGEAISKASSLEEVERLQKLLQSGQIPGQEQNGNYNGRFLCLLTNNFSYVWMLFL